MIKLTEVARGRCHCGNEFVFKLEEKTTKKKHFYYRFEYIRKKKWYQFWK